MNNYLFIDAVSHLDTDLLAEHLEKKDKLRNKLKSKRKVNILRWSAVAACFTFVIVMSVLLIPNFVDGPDVPGITPGPDVGVTNNKLLISSIPNAQVISNAEYFLAERPTVSDIYTVEEYIEVLKNHFTTVTGSVTNMNSVAIEEGDFTWYITTFDINIHESLKQQIEADTITCVSICKYYGDVSLNESKCGLTDVAYEIASNPTGFFVLEDVIEDDMWIINGETYNVADYADYYAGVRYDCTTEGFQYYGTLISFDDIRN